MNFGQSAKLPVRYRVWIKSNVPGLYVHSLSASSISKFKFGGTLWNQLFQPWITLQVCKSTLPPWLDRTQIGTDNLIILTLCIRASYHTLLTCADGYSIAMHIAQFPVPVPISKIFCGYLPIGAQCSFPPKRSNIR